MIIRNPWFPAFGITSFITLLCFSLSISRVQSYPMPPEFYKLSDELVSWHIPWAKPYAGGSIRALVIAPRGAQRETIELAQRLSMDYTYVLALSPTELGWTEKSGPYASANGLSNPEVITELRRKLKIDYDVILIGQIQWSAFPNDILYDIIKKVHDGTGLVYSCSSFGRVPFVDKMLSRGDGEDKNSFVTTGIPFVALPTFQGGGLSKVVGLKQFKRGRIVTLDYGKSLPHFQFLTPFVPDSIESYTDLHYEYYMSLVIKAVLWAAQREPDVFIRDWEKNGSEWNRQEISKAKLTGEIFSSQPLGRLDTVMTVRTVDGTPVFVHRLTVQEEGKNKILNYPLSVLPCGRYFVDLVLSRDGKSINWATTYLDVTSAQTIVSVETDKKSYKPGETILVTAKVSEPHQQNNRLVISIIDSLKREIGKTETRIQSDGRSQGSIKLLDPLTITAQVQVSLMESKDLIDTKISSFSILRHQWDDFLFCVWSAGSSFNERSRRLMFNELTKAGVDTFTNSGPGATTARRMAELGFWGIPYMTRYSYEDRNLVRKPCLTDPNFLKGHLEGLEKAAAELYPFDPQGYTLGDECFLARDGVDVCFSPTCLADFRQWLQTEYPSIEALNASWGTALKSFDDATPMTLSEAKTSGQIARWVDHRRHMEFVYARMMARAREAIRKSDPVARVGFDGPFDTSSASGNDWWRLMQVFDLCNLYFHEPDQWEQVRSFARPGTLLGLWYGRYSFHEDENYMRLFPWRTLLHGYNSVWWYAVYHGLSVCPMDAMTPSMKLYPYFEATAEEIREIKSGFGKALMNATRLDDGIAVHYSQSSVHLSTAFKGLGLLNETQRRWYDLLEDMGLQYSCRSYAQIENEGLDPARWRVLILPYSQALSPREAEAMKTFVEAGGTLLADIRPGLTDHHGKRQQPGLLDELFGIHRASGEVDLKHRVEGELINQLGALPDKTILSAITTDPGITVTTGKALGKAGETPILIVHEVGKGRVILLNFAINSYGAVRSSKSCETYWSLLQGLLARASVKPCVEVRTAEGGLRQCETVFFRDGAVEYLGFLKYRCNPKEEPQKAEVHFDHAAHTYDAHSGEYFGKVDRLTATFQPDKARIMSRLPYAVQEISVKTRKKSARTGERIEIDLQLTVSDNQPDRHWVHVAVFGPDKLERRHYATNVAVIKGKGQTLVPLALNDARGEWHLTAREIASGVEGKTQFQVK